MMKSSLVPLASCLFLWGGESSSFAAAFSHGPVSLISPSTSMSQHHDILSQRREAHIFCGKRTNALCKLRMRSATLKTETTLKSALGPRRGVKAFTGLGIFLFTLLSSKSAIAKTAATTVSTAAAAPVLLPPMHKIVLACLLPTLLGFYKSEYGVSYGYGTAMAASSYLILASISQSAGLPLAVSFASSTKPAAILTSLSAMLDNLRTLLPASLPAFHAFALFFYGTRLNLFLFYRELCLPRFRAMRERIEDRAKKQGGRLKRTPFLLSCTFLYFCMVCPVLVTTKVCEGMSMSCAVGLGGSLSSILEQSLRLSLIVALSGFLLGAFGDLNKSIGKMLNGEDTLITGGIFRYFRHPNYTGEVIGWTSSCLAAFVAVALKAVTDSSNGGLHIWKSMAGYLSLSVIGTIGICFVLGAATAGLEFRQHEKYGDTEEYKQWVKKSWVGFNMGKRKKDDSENAQETKE